MPLESAIPILAYLEHAATVTFYKEVLGFECNADWDGYIMCSREKIEIHLWKCDNEEIPKHTGCYVRVSDIKNLYSEYEKQGIIHPNGKLEVKPWGMVQFSVLDNSGNIINFGERLIH